MVKVTMLGEPVDIDELPSTAGTEPLELADHFRPVKLSALAINEASKIVPSEFWIKEGLYTFLQRRADHVFGKLAGSEREGRLGKMKYIFEFDHEGPVLKTVFLG